jgi:hypothetical protein
MKQEWRVSGEGLSAIIRDHEGRILAVRHRLKGDENEAVMRRIVQCVNSHDVMLAALRQAEKWIVQQMMDNGCPAERLEQPPEGSHLFNIRAAIKKAGAA